jgi:L-fuconolactonase
MSQPAPHNYLPIREEWLKLHEEEILEPELPIVDAHHHFYDRPGWQYPCPDFVRDASTGHAVRASVYMQALTRYRTSGADALKPVGETEYVAQATQLLQDGEGALRVASGIVGYADMRAGTAVREVLEAHVEAGRGRFRGIRHLTAWDADTSLANPLTSAPAGLLLDKTFRAGLGELAPLGLSYDAWLFFPQLPELVDTAKRFPDTAFVLDHCGGIVRIGAYQGRGDEVFDLWGASMRELARLPNVHVKLGGLGMRINGFGFEKAELPPSSDLLARTWKPWMETCIELFGADRCMFESNFPVDKGSYSYSVGWNAFKRLSAGYSPSERHALFEGTATRVYRLI